MRLIKNFKNFNNLTKLNEGSNIAEELLENDENMFFVYFHGELIGAMEYLSDALNDLLLVYVTGTEEEEYEFLDLSDTLTTVIGTEHDDMTQSELDDGIEEFINDLGKTPSMFKVVKREEIEKGYL